MELDHDINTEGDINEVKGHALLTLKPRSCASMEVPSGGAALTCSLEDER